MNQNPSISAKCPSGITGHTVAHVVGAVNGMKIVDGNTHAKVLIKDRDFAAITSFNWLSFAGDPNRTFRDEQGILLRRPELVEQKFSELEPRFRVPAGPAANSS